jgi:two-component system, NarL family, sensor kinase
MAENTRRFHVIRGSRGRTFSEAQGIQRGNTTVESMDNYSAKSRSDDLSVSLRAMEKRSATLLEERGRLTKDLHDCVLQSLYAIGLNLGMPHRRNVHGAPNNVLSGDPVLGQLNRLIQEVRGMIRSLESGSVQEFDLAAELQNLIDTYRQLSPLHITTHVAPPAVTKTTNEEKRELFMIVREAVSNCIRHAQAVNATVSLYAQGDNLRLLIADDGVGFTQEAIRRKGYGLANIATRAKKLGGRLLISSHLGKGTRILVEFTMEPGLSSL